MGVVLLMVFVLMGAIILFLGAMTAFVQAASSEPCDYCRKMVQKTATICPYCQRERHGRSADA